MTELEAIVALNMIPDVGSVRLKNLLEAFGSAPRIFLNSPEKLKQVEKIGSKIANVISAFPFENLKKEFELAKKLKIKILTLYDAQYPKRLKEIYDPPICLYVKGDILPQDEISLGIVGSRRASFYGLQVAEKFAYSLAQLKFTIVSGLARGVDSSAHKGALKAKGRTLAILGSGLNCIYPQDNLELAEEISHAGAVISEFPLNFGPLPRNFPRRNRVISGLSMGVIVVEAAKNSGALITADFALEQGREVFAVPGKVDSATSFGTNQLIKQGAKLTDSIEDILEELKLDFSSKEGSSRKAVIAHSETAQDSVKKEAVVKKQIVDETASFSEEEDLIYNLLDDKPRFVDEVVERTKLAVNRVMPALLKLEMRNFIKQLPGKKFVRSERNA